MGRVLSGLGILCLGSPSDFKALPVPTNLMVLKANKTGIKPTLVGFTG